jgi:glycosyltransferase involved in cell wall biosynthesis
MKVLVVGPDRQDPGGVANYYNAVFPRLSNGEVIAHYFEIGSTYGKSRIAHVVNDQIRFWRILDQFRPDVVHLNPSLVLKSFLRDGMFIFIAKMRRKPVLVFFRGWEEPLEKKVSGILRWYFKATYGQADAFIVLASKFSDRLRHWGVTAPVHLGTTTVEDGLLNSFSIEAKAGDLLETGSVRLLYLARLERRKGVLELIEAVKGLLESGESLTLTIAGDGPMMDHVRQMVSSFNQYQDRIHIAGYVRGQEKIDLFHTHHIFCLPTQYDEGMPNSILEAMAFGMPVITCPVGGLADFFDDPKMGVLLNDGSAHLISDAIKLLISDRTRLADIARYNHEYAQRHFLASSAAELLRIRYKEVAKAIQRS